MLKIHFHQRSFTFITFTDSASRHCRLELEHERNVSYTVIT